MEQTDIQEIKGSLPWERIKRYVLTNVIWDTSNRAINLPLNNLKGVFFPDDDIGHMAFAVLGGWSGQPKTTILVGDSVSRSERIMTYLLGDLPLH